MEKTDVKNTVRRLVKEISAEDDHKTLNWVAEALREVLIYAREQRIRRFIEDDTAPPKDERQIH